ncbi:MAG: hypothetical protein RL518_1255 [Pseudomonadota bacterium]
MTTLTRPRSLAPMLLALCVFVSGCSGISSGGSLREAELSITPTEQSGSFSLTAQAAISHLGLTPEQLADPSGLETNEHAAKETSPVERSLVLAEAWFLRGQNDLEVPLSLSLERFFRAAHYAYEGLFGESGCQEPQGQLCRDLSLAYNRSVREVARLTQNGAQPPSSRDSRYVVDLQADDDPLTLSEWEIVFDDERTGGPVVAIGSAGSGCQELVGEDGTPQHRVRQCIPITFIVTFDERAGEERSRAHLVAFNTLERDEIQLHGKTVALASSPLAPWVELFTTGPDAPRLSCLGNAHPALPTVVYLTPSIQTSYEWPVIGAEIARDSLLHQHYNFCAVNPSITPSPSGGEFVSIVAGGLTTLHPNVRTSASVVLVAQGAAGDGAAKEIKKAIKERARGEAAPLTVSGTLSFPAPPPLAPNVLPIPLSTPADLTRGGSVALADIKRLLSRLADPEEGVFGGLTRTTLAPSPEGRLSPVM